MLITHIGNMASGKTQKLIQLYNANKNNAIVCLPEVCKTRSKFFPTNLENSLQSRTGEEVQVQYYIQPNDDFSAIQHVDMILIDEFNQMNINQIKMLSKSDKIIHLFGLRLDTHGNAYESAIYALTHSDRIEIVERQCTHCENNSLYDQMYDRVYLSDGRLDYINSKYEPVCKLCFEKNEANNKI